MISITKQEGLYQNKVNSILVSTCNCKMSYRNLEMLAFDERRKLKYLSVAERLEPRVQAPL